MDELTFAREQMPILIGFNVEPKASDQWVRDLLKGPPSPSAPLQYVIVQGTKEADRLIHLMPKAKSITNKAYGGAYRMRWPGW